MEKSADPDQLASEKPADQDLHCFLKRIYPGSPGQWFINYNSSINEVFRSGACTG